MAKTETEVKIIECKDCGCKFRHDTQKKDDAEPDGRASWVGYSFLLRTGPLPIPTLCESCNKKRQRKARLKAEAKKYGLKAFNILLTIVCAAGIAYGGELALRHNNMPAGVFLLILSAFWLCFNYRKFTSPYGGD